MRYELCKNWIGKTCSLGPNVSFMNRMEDCGHGYEDVLWIRCPRNPVRVKELIDVHVGAGTYGEDILKKFPDFKMFDPEIHNLDDCMTTVIRPNGITDWSYQIVKE